MKIIVSLVIALGVTGCALDGSDPSEQEGSDSTVTEENAKDEAAPAVVEKPANVKAQAKMQW